MAGLVALLKSYKVTADLVMGMIIMGTTGAVIGLNLGGFVFTAAATLLGIMLGGFVSMLGARRFFISVLVGSFIGGALALWLGGPYAFIIGAGSGGAIGGFIGVNIELFKRG
ncbi:MAG: hypothetical protein HY203_06610 [Nitrospirae bacterium]|nr:hypothetical protein [Nitrospirota bacterium]